jgi:hypothetical protein
MSIPKRSRTVFAQQQKSENHRDSCHSSTTNMAFETYCLLTHIKRHIVNECLQLLFDSSTPSTDIIERHSAWRDIEQHYILCGTIGYDVVESHLCMLYDIYLYCKLYWDLQQKVSGSHSEAFLLSIQWSLFLTSNPRSLFNEGPSDEERKQSTSLSMERNGSNLTDGWDR